MASERALRRWGLGAVWGSGGSVDERNCGGRKSIGTGCCNDNGTTDDAPLQRDDAHAVLLQHELDVLQVPRRIFNKFLGGGRLGRGGVDTPPVPVLERCRRPEQPASGSGGGALEEGAAAAAGRRHLGCWPALRACGLAGLRVGGERGTSASRRLPWYADI